MIKFLLIGIIIFSDGCSMNNEYEIKTTINNEQHTTHFFKTWEGYSHPVRPVAPITYQEAQNLNTYYEVTFKAINGAPRLIFF